MSKLISVAIDKGTKLQGYIAIDSTVNGRCHGGLRMAPDIASDSIARVAREQKKLPGVFMYSLIARHMLAPVLDFSRGTKIMKRLKELEKSQWWSRDKILELQNQRLKQLVRHAYDNVPYYRCIFDERALKPNDIECSEDLAKLPVLTKQLIRSNFDDLMAGGLSGKERIQHATSGSTGEPLVFYTVRDDLNWGSAALQRAYEWTGYEIGDKCVSVWRRYSYKPMVNFREAAAKFFERILFFDVEKVSTENMPFFAKKLKHFQPEFIRGYPSSIYLLARVIEREGKPRVRPKAIITAGEQLYDYQRELFWKVFACETYSCYGSWEVPAIASECSEHCGYHIAAENVIVEAVNDKGKPVPVGSEGKILVTSMHNYAMPFIRYDIGDVGEISDKACSCGRGLPLLAKLSGRTTDIILTRSSGAIPGIALPRTFLAHLGIDQWQIVQENYQKVVVKVVLEKECPQERMDELAREIIARYRPIFGEDMDITVEFVDQIPLTRAGKRRVVISNLPRGGE